MFEKASKKRRPPTLRVEKEEQHQKKKGGKAGEEEGTVEIIRITTTKKNWGKACRKARSVAQKDDLFFCVCVSAFVKSDA